MLDITLFRVDQGGNPDLIRESQKRRYADVTLVDKVIEYDGEWRQARGALNDANKAVNDTNKEMGGYFKKKEKPPPELAEKKKEQEAEIKRLEEKVKQLEVKRNDTIGLIGNLVPDDVPVDDDEDNNLVVDTNGTFEREDWMLSHYDLVQLAGMANTEKGSKVAGSRGYFLTGFGMRLNQALISYAVQFLSERGHTMIQTPFVMNKGMMGKVAQLADFDEQLYKVSGGAEDQYLIATSEQPLCGYHDSEWIGKSELPRKYAGYSTCFRKEAGSHGRDQAGIFRVHQFEKVEQFCVTSPEGDESWKMQDSMMANCKEFYQSLGIPYRVVNIVSGALNDAAAKKYDLEAWFPGSNAHRELVSCSNCTDYQSRRLEVRYGQQGKSDDGKKVYVHMLNSTLVATERAMCCVIENYQTKCGIKIPDVLQEYMGGVSFVPFVTTMPKPKKGPAPPQYVPTPAQIKEMDSGKAELQEYMNALLPTLNAALNTLAKTKPADPVASLAALLSAGGGGGGAPKAEKIAGAMTAEELAKKDKEELEAKKKAEAKKQAEKDAVEAANIAKMNELEASGKKVSGGMHKFDSSEVDVNGGNATADDFMDAFGFGDGAADVSDAPSGGDIDYGVHLKAHIEGALVEVLKKCPADPFKAIQQILFQASLDNADPPPAAPRPSSDEVTKFMELYNMENEIEACLFKLKKRCVTGPKDGAKFLVSDAGDFFTEKSKALKAQGGPRGVMTAEELKAADAAAAKAKREKEAKAEAERDAADAENAKKTAEMEAQGKKVSGGLHKFDASEVDINGGSGTADDFMDAFGF